MLKIKNSVIIHKTCSINHSYVLHLDNIGFQINSSNNNNNKLFFGYTPSLTLSSSPSWNVKGIGQHSQFSYNFVTKVQSNEKSVDKDTFKKYSKTLNLPNSTFSIRANPSVTEPKMQEICCDSLYQNQHPNPDISHNGKTFVLHDGPPYANGDLHIGHAVNKILKDIVNRWKLLQGYQIHYRPGWDCHGLPIELKAIHIDPKNSSSMKPDDIRFKARDFAQSTILKQKKDFKRWGIMGDWDRPYTTMEPSFEAAQLKVFLKMFEKGYIYRGKRPIYWSPSSLTALAEAELEYPENHVSKSIYVRFPVTISHKETSNPLLPFHNNLYALIWTTTPWTLMANEAVCYSNSAEYCIVQEKESSHYIIIAKELLESYMRKTDAVLDVKITMKGNELFTKYIKGYKDVLLTIQNAKEKSSYTPTLPDKKFIHGDHVTIQQGTGLVHTAPGHGMEDFLIGKQHNLPVTCPVGADGSYLPSVRISSFKGLNVLKEGNDAVLDFLKSSSQNLPFNALAFLENYNHKYPYDWRTKKPVIIRTTRQWFAQLQDLRGPATQALQSVRMVPEHGSNKLTSMIEKRNEWCISRQRVWGVPIPAFYYRDNAESNCQSNEGEIDEEEKVLATKETIEHVISLVEKHGTDCWWKLSTEELLPPQYRNNGIHYRKGEDTLDVWFDSGTTWFSVLKESNQNLFPADLYLEGSDQHRGWFQSSLLCSVAYTNQSPYRCVVTHGFTLDENGKKMSKSLGNVVEPSLIVNGGKQKIGKKEKLYPALGADIMRLWVACSDFTHDMSIGPNIMDQEAENYRKIRNTARFMLGVLFDYSPQIHNSIDYESLSHIDKYALCQLYEFIKNVEHNFETFQFYKTHQSIVNFVYELSSFYLDIVKDRLYSDHVNGSARRHAQYVIGYLLEALTKSVAPICCHLAEEIYQHSPIAFPVGREHKREKESLFHTQWVSCQEKWNQIELKKAMGIIVDLRHEVYKLIEKARAQKLIGSGLEAMVDIPLTEDLINCFGTSNIPELEKALEEIFIVSEVNIYEGDIKPIEIEEQVFERTLPRSLKNAHESDFLSEDDGDPSGRSSSAAILRVQRARGTKCHRCWKYTPDAPLCKRCSDVLLSNEKN